MAAGLFLFIVRCKKCWEVSANGVVVSFCVARGLWIILFDIIKSDKSSYHVKQRFLPGYVRGNLSKEHPSNFQSNRKSLLPEVISKVQKSRIFWLLYVMMCRRQGIQKNHSPLTLSETRAKSLFQRDNEILKGSLEILSIFCEYKKEFAKMGEIFGSNIPLSKSMKLPIFWNAVPSNRVIWQYYFLSSTLLSFQGP